MKNKDIEYLTWENFELWEQTANKNFVPNDGSVWLSPDTIHNFLATIRALCELSVQEVPCELCNGMGVIECAPDKQFLSTNLYQHPPSDVQFQGCPKCGGSKKKYKTPAEVLTEIEDLREISILKWEGK